MVYLCQKEMAFTICFLALRYTTGGFHANSFPDCFAGSVVTVVLSLEVFEPLLANYKMWNYIQWRSIRLMLL